MSANEFLYEGDLVPDWQDRVDLDCNCRGHALRVWWERNDPTEPLFFEFWTHFLGDWMTLWTRLCKAWEVLTKGASCLDDVEVDDPAKARELAALCIRWADAWEGELARREEQGQ